MKFQNLNSASKNKKHDEQKAKRVVGTDDVDGDCFSFNLYRNTEGSIVLLKRWRGDFRKEEYCQIYQQCFYLEELT